MYDTKESFLEDVGKCGKYYEGLTVKLKDVAYVIYDKAKMGTIFAEFSKRQEEPGITIVGRLALKDESGEWVESDEKYPSIDPKMKNDLKVLNEESETAGSILDTENWSLLANDSWLLGGIHGRTEFHFASRIISENLWDNKKQRPTVMGRELIGIVSLGYKLSRQNRKLEPVAELETKSVALASTLLDYKTEVEKYKSEKDFRKIIAKIPKS